jgi:hypothetical protein
MECPSLRQNSTAGFRQLLIEINRKEGYAGSIADGPSCRPKRTALQAVDQTNYCRAVFSLLQLFTGVKSSRCQVFMNAVVLAVRATARSSAYPSISKLQAPIALFLRKRPNRVSRRISELAPDSVSAAGRVTHHPSATRASRRRRRRLRRGGGGRGLARRDAGCKGS